MPQQQGNAPFQQEETLSRTRLIRVLMAGWVKEKEEGEE